MTEYIWDIPELGLVTVAVDGVEGEVPNNILGLIQRIDAFAANIPGAKASESVDFLRPWLRPKEDPYRRRLKDEILRGCPHVSISKQDDDES